ncbi:MAG: GHKL domain-containing protein [Desulfobacter sp.]|nr:GHKL domain-containing protein [Desulfobacter sp.]WDP86363.1 MAG: GHKL domain-containing protein [Desulfobacter sp.]
MPCTCPFSPWQAQLDSQTTLLQRSNELFGQIKWGILSRAVFAIVLIFSTLFFSNNNPQMSMVVPFLSLYKMAGAVLVLSILYFFWLNQKKHLKILAYVQTIADSILVTAIIFVTGGYHSIFTFLYLVVIIYTAMLLLQRGSFVIATLSSVQYGLLVELEYFGIISPFMGGASLGAGIDDSQVIYRIIITIAACFAVAALSGILSFQLKTARQDLKITQEHLKRVEKMSAVDEMISGIAHEIKNPLASLSGSIQLLKDETQQGSDENRLMQIILRETDRLKQIVNDIRLISKPGRANAKIVNMAQSIEDVKALFLNTPHWKSRIQLITKLEKELCVSIDPVHLQQILWNLIKNAAEAIEGQGKIIITLNSPRNKRIYLTIRDTGKGIDEKQARHIFDPFFTTKQEGTGLGLSIIHRIIDAYEGMIDFESIPEKGTLFTLIFKNTSSG